MSKIVGSRLVARALKDQGADAVFTIVAGPVVDDLAVKALGVGERAALGQHVGQQIARACLGAMPREARNRSTASSPWSSPRYASARSTWASA